MSPGAGLASGEDREGAGPIYAPEPTPPGMGHEPPVPSYTAHRARRKKHRSAARSVIDFIVIFGGAILVAYLLQAYIVKPFQIPTESMMPTIDPGDRILVNRMSYRTSSPQRGDIIVFKAPTDPTADYVKRVIAVAGDTIEVKQGRVILNGEAQNEPYVMAENKSTFHAQQVPEGTVFVMGDNRADSQDSRFWTIPWLDVDSIVGKAFLIYWPPGRMGGV